MNSPLIHSMRLRTLPLSLAGAIMGTCLAVAAGYSTSILTYICLFLTTVSLQILSNLSNELGDFLCGTDGEQREGPLYSLAKGAISVKRFKQWIVLFVILCCSFGLAMIYTSFGTFFEIKPLILILLGAAAITAAMRYTLGKNPYGYRGLGDIFVFIFFGLVSVLGSYFVIAHTIDHWQLLLPAAAIGCFSVGVLNTNNIRDMASDAENRITIPLKIGEKKAKIYQFALIIIGLTLMTTFIIINDLYEIIFICILPFYAHHLFLISHTTGKQLDKALPLLVITTFVFALAQGIAMIIQGLTF